MFFLQERVYRPTESRQIGVIDPHSRIMVLHLYAGLLKVGTIYTHMYMYILIVINVIKYMYENGMDVTCKSSVTVYKCM